MRYGGRKEPFSFSICHLSFDIFHWSLVIGNRRRLPSLLVKQFGKCQMSNDKWKMIKSFT